MAGMSQVSGATSSVNRDSSSFSSLTGWWYRLALPPYMTVLMPALDICSRSILLPDRLRVPSALRASGGTAITDRDRSSSVMGEVFMDCANTSLPGNVEYRFGEMAFLECLCAWFTGSWKAQFVWRKLLG